MLSHSASKAIARPLRAAVSKTAQKTSTPRLARSVPLKVAFKPKGLVTKPVFHEQKRYYNLSRVMREEKAETVAEGEQAAATNLTPEQIAQLQEELSSTKKSLAETAKVLQETKEKLLHSYAERENIRRIANKDVETAKEFGIKNFAMKMFDVLDTLDICLENLPKEFDGNAHLENAYIGLESTKKQFVKVMGEYEVVPMETKVGDKFDANYHNAIFEVQPTSPEHKPQTVGVIVKGGWLRKGNLLRPTHVGVVMKSL